MSKDLFMMMREQEVVTNNFLPTKKELQKSSKEFAKNIVDSGEHNLQEIYATALRLKESLTAIESELKNALGEESFEAFGLKASFRNGGDTVNYSDDEMISDLENQIKERKELLKTALKSTKEIYDDNGVLVPKVTTTPRKSSLSISF